MELREMTEAGMMRLAILKYDEAEMQTLEELLGQMKAALDSGENAMDNFFRLTTSHDIIAQMGKKPLSTT